MTDAGEFGRPEAVEREARWLRIHETRLEEWRTVRVADFIELAFHVPRLRSRMPGFRHWMPHLRDEGRDVFAVEPTAVPGRYPVLTAGRRVLGEGDAAVAPRIMLESMAE